MKFSCLILASLILTLPVSAQSLEKWKAIKPAMQKFVDNNELAGAVTVVGRKSGVVHLEAVGFRDKEAKAPMTPDALFRIASMTKPITAMAVLMLQEDGKLNVEDPVEKYLPEFKGQMLQVSKVDDVVTLKKPSRPITLRDMLTHTSGLPGGYPAGLGDVYTLRNRTLNETTLVISQQPLFFEPGTKWSYCNSGIDTLGRVVEVVSGMSYEAFLQKRLFDPLKMTQTTFRPSIEQLKNLATTYSVKDKQLNPAPKTFLAALPTSEHPIPAGGLASTAGDIAKLYQCLLNGGELDGVRVIGEKTLGMMTQTQTGDIKTGFTDGMSFGFGFAVVKTPTGITEKLSPGTFGHGGAFGTQSWADPKKDLFMILMIQRTGIPNGDASIYRKTFQDLALSAIE
ncbi:MAG: serine hydrolase domain-containing protein [Fimbriiglobus sp.]